MTIAFNVHSNELVGHIRHAMEVIVRKSTLEDKGFSLDPTQLSKSYNKDRSIPRE